MAEYDDEYWEDDELPVPQAPVAGGADSIPVDGGGAAGRGDVEEDGWQKSCWTFHNISSTPERASS